MSRKVAHLLVLLALLVLPAWASHTSHHCYTTCYNESYPSCGGFPPGAEHDQCVAFIVEACRCQCYPPEYCP